ncbi:uncharacterized protein LOC133288708 isoform X2 [Gastrolobium bilobum]|uniref:uncharacterized protein LOC133288708 isoform X2 n=1 Tax=Gastrolobium bilobum TaxID=150636 RepID=UPI002AAFD5D4|nr:uncharacterized protein LOC133288708 isoform X2 [Gastrolobium bilobum]
MLNNDDDDDDDDLDVFFDSVDWLSPPQEFGYDVWMNEPLSVKERRERFLQGMMGLDDASPKVCLQEKMMSYDSSSVRLGLERIRDCSGAVSNATDHVPVKLVHSGCEPTSEAQVMFDELKGCPDDKSDASVEGKVYELSYSDQELRHGEAEVLPEFFGDFDIGIKKKKNWWDKFVNRKKGGGGKVRSKLSKGTNKTRRIKVRRNKKRWTEFSALYMGQEIRAHKGLIWTMKFSPSGKYLASGGEDGVIRIWRVKKRSSQSFIVLPNKIFKIEESPMQEFYGHSSDVLDLAWSSSDTLLSSSMDKTVRLWQIGCCQCLSVFHHKDYVTCIQFNPVDENYFISGSIDGKVRIWGIHEERVVDWADIRDVISAISYQPDGKGFVVGSLTGTCRFYVASGKYFQLEAQIHVNGKKKIGSKITGIQFSQNNHKKVMITSEDSKIRILEGVELVQKYKGLPWSGSQMSGSFTSSGKHIVSVGEDSRVYIWNFNDMENASSKHTKSEHSCEYFRSKGVTVAIPWSGMSAEQMGFDNDFAHYSSEMQHQLEAASVSRESERVSCSSWFSIDATCRGSMTWPEEKLPSLDLPIEEVEFDHQQLCLKDPSHDNCVSETWGLSIVAAGCDGTIKTFHNFGLPIR